MTVRCVLAHDLINSITAIIALAELLNDHATDPECRRRVADIQKLADRMATALLTRQCAACSEPAAHQRTRTAAVV